MGPIRLSDEDLEQMRLEKLRKAGISSNLIQLSAYLHSMDAEPEPFFEDWYNSNYKWWSPEYQRQAEKLEGKRPLDIDL